MHVDYKSRAAVYLRKSRSDDADESVEETLNRHEKILTEYALKHDITIAASYKEVVSGDGLFTREQMLKLLGDIEQGMYTAVMCIDIDRLGRSSSKDSGIIMETLKDNGCLIITPEKVYDLENEVDEMTVELKTFFARQELKSIRKRLTRGVNETLKAGGHTGEPPYGYRRKWLDKIPTLEPVEEEAEAVRMIYEWYVNDGYGSHTIADKLNILGIKAPGGGEFSRSSVRMILSNPIYKGDIVWNRTARIKRRTASDKWRIKRNDEEKWIKAKGLHEPIIAAELWERANYIRVNRFHPAAFTGIVKNAYSGLVICKNCGRTMQRSCPKKAFEDYLLCTNKACMPSIKLSVIDARVKMQMRDVLKELKTDTKQRKDSGEQRIKQELTAAKRQIKTISSQMERLHDLLEQGIYDIGTFETRRRALTEKETRIEDEVKKLSARLQETDSRRGGEEMIPQIESLLKKWDDLIPADKNKLLKILINKIVYSRASGKKNAEVETEIEWRF